MSDDTPLSPEQERSLAAALDEIIPTGPGGRLPGAGELGLGPALWANAELRPLLVAGLAAVGEVAREQGAAGFAALPRHERRAALEAAEGRTPGFVPTLVFQTLVAYYQDPRVREALGLENRPPFPLGYEVAPTDFSILDPVRARPPIYREP